MQLLRNDKSPLNAYVAVLFSKAHLSRSILITYEIRKSFKHRRFQLFKLSESFCDLGTGIESARMCVSPSELFMYHVDKGRSLVERFEWIDNVFNSSPTM
jgi:hypothetical protein